MHNCKCKAQLLLTHITTPAAITQLKLRTFQHLTRLPQGLPPLPVKEMFGIKTLVERRPGFHVSKIPQAWKTQKSLEIVCGEGVSLCQTPGNTSLEAASTDSTLNGVQGAQE